MIKLYAFPMSCSYAVHVALIASGLPFEEVWVRWPEGLLTETPAILQYIADLAPHARLAPPNGTFART